MHFFWRIYVDGLNDLSPLRRDQKCLARRSPLDLDIPRREILLVPGKEQRGRTRAVCGTDELVHSCLVRGAHLTGHNDVQPDILSGRQ